SPLLRLCRGAVRRRGRPLWHLVLELAADTMGLAASLGLRLRLRLLLSGHKTSDRAEAHTRRGRFTASRKASGLPAVLGQAVAQACCGNNCERSRRHANTRDARKIIRGWMALANDKRDAGEQLQRIVNAFFFGVTIFSVAFAYFVLFART